MIGWKERYKKSLLTRQCQSLNQCLFGLQRIRIPRKILMSLLKLAYKKNNKLKDFETNGMYALSVKWFSNNTYFC